MQIAMDILEGKNSDENYINCDGNCLSCDGKCLDDDNLSGIFEEVDLNYDLAPKIDLDFDFSPEEALDFEKNYTQDFKHFLKNNKITEEKNEYDIKIVYNK